MNNLKISTRLLILIAMLSILLIGIGGVGLFGISKSNDALESVYKDRTVSMAQIAEIQRLLLRNRLAIAVALVTPNSETITASTAEVEANIATISTIWKGFMSNALTLEEVDLAKTFTENRSKFVRDGLLPVVAALRADKIAEANRLVGAAIRPLYIPVGSGIDALMKLQQELAKKKYEESDQRYTTIRMVFIASIIAGLLFSISFGTILIRNITHSLDKALQLSNLVARGDLSQSIDVQGKDEVAQLLQGLSFMQKSLTKVVSDVRSSSESVATASAQIALGNQDLAERTEQQASALEETAASMEELASTVRHNADNAHQINQLALSASMTASKGGQEVAQAVETMKGINESSKKISEITSVIDSIAFQTNILALNAAVEAARAGEQGRGFAVVASEVRSLAGRSADAAKEIKNLINVSVMRVEKGSMLVDQAGGTMREVVSAIERVTDLMREISTASAEQSQGVAEIGQAITQMDQTTQQNAVLVEQMAAAASSLKEQSQDLVGTVAVFTLPSSDTPPARAFQSTQVLPLLPRHAKEVKRGTTRQKVSLGLPLNSTEELELQAVR